MKIILLISTLLLSLPGLACFQGIFDAKSQTLSQQLQAEQQAAQQLMNLAQSRFDMEKQYSRNLLDSYIKFTSEKGKLNRGFNRAPLEIAKAELAMAQEQLKVKQQCRERANTHQTAQDKEVTVSPVTTNATNLAGSYRRLKNEYLRSYRQCMSDPVIVEGLHLAVKGFHLAVQGIRQDQNEAMDQLQELTGLTIQAQNYDLQTRDKHRQIFAYQEAVVRQMQARAISMAMQIGSNQQTGAALQCFMQIIQGLGSGGTRDGVRTPSSDSAI